MPFPIIPLIAALSPMIGGALSGLGGAGAQRQANRANQRMAQTEFDNNLRMWNMQNAYNTPAAQMQRFKDAGLNPNLIYGQGNSGNASVLPRYSRADQQPVDYISPIGGGVLGMLSGFQDYQVKQAQIDNLKAQNLAIQANTLMTETRQGMAATQAGTVRATQPFTIKQAQYDALLKEQQFDQKSQLFPYSLEYATGRNAYQSTQIQKMFTDMDRTKASTEYQKLQNEWYLTKLFGGMAADIVKIMPGLKSKMFSTGGSFNQNRRIPPMKFNAPNIRYNKSFYSPGR